MDEKPSAAGPDSIVSIAVSTAFVVAASNLKSSAISALGVLSCAFQQVRSASYTTMLPNQWKEDPRPRDVWGLPKYLQGLS